MSKVPDPADTELVPECLDNSISPEDSDSSIILPRHPRVCPISLPNISRDIIQKGRQKLQAAIKKLTDQARSQKKSCDHEYYDMLLLAPAPKF